MVTVAIAYVALFWTLLATTVSVSFGRPANADVVEAKSEESYEANELIALPLSNSTFLHILHPNASELIYGDNDTLARNKRCCCCCDCCCCCCCGGGGSSEEGVAIADMIAMASLLQSQLGGTQQASETASSAAVQHPGLGYLPYPLVPRSVNWDNAPAGAVGTSAPTGGQPLAEALPVTVADVQPEISQAEFSSRINPGEECVEDEDCVNGAACLPQYSWTGVFEKRCVCRAPYLHVGETCVAV